MNAMDFMRPISNIIKVEWAPLHLPLSRRLQTLAATAWIMMIILGEFVSVYLYVKVLYSRLWWVALLYGVWYLQDIDIRNQGGRTIEWVRNWAWWRYYRDYFPLKLVKTQDLDPRRNYLFACFPHGLVSSGAFGAFGTNALGFKELFPGLSSQVITLGGHFLIPFFRELILSLGACSSSKESLLYLLDKRSNSGKCAALIVGGAAEAIDAHPGQYKVILSRRRGFIRVALMSGAPLVPVFSFGEPDVFRPLNNPEGGWLRRLQNKTREVTGISPIFPIGRGLFQYSFGVVPLRRPVTTVVGAPIEVTRNPDPTEKEVEALHAEFTLKLIELFEKEKSKYLENYEKAHLVIV